MSLSRLADEILRSHRCAVGQEHGFGSLFVARDGSTADLADLDTALEELAEAGLLERSTREHEGRAIYHPKRDAWRAHEERLRTVGARHRVFARLDQYALDDVVLGLAAGSHAQQRRVPSGYYATRGEIAIEDLCAYLYDVSEVDVRAAIARLLGQRLLEPIRAVSGTSEREGVLATLSGLDAFDRTVRPRLGLARTEILLDVHRKDAIRIFYSWQSDVAASRSDIEQALTTVVARLNTEHDPLQRVVVEQATREGDGAAAINEVLLERIERADLVVGDITATGVLCGRRTPNPNVLFEVGVARGMRPPEDLVLLASREASKQRDPKEHDWPFDIANLRRHEYRDVDELTSWLHIEVRARLRTRNWLRKP